MKIAVTKSSDNAFEITFGEQKISVGLDDLKSLLMEVTRVLTPGGGLSKRSDTQASDLVSRMKTADDVGIQNFIPSVDEDDILILLKYGEDDEALLKKFYSNMSERSRKMHAEDMAYKFQNGIPSGQLEAAISRLLKTAQQMEEDGSLTFAL
ncbi:MAG: hypothetical protein HOB79_09615 [Rhodospirillaceae bacterium]|jgi:hypothetical protein|nr:hypothetical protein [Rhodospirillaceae bacterium]MBT8004786.1 hypothetical protein [Rhodospirillales bacterium]